MIDFVTLSITVEDPDAQFEKFAEKIPAIVAGELVNERVVLVDGEPDADDNKVVGRDEGDKINLEDKEGDKDPVALCVRLDNPLVAKGHTVEEKEVDKDGDVEGVTCTVDASGEREIVTLTLEDTDDEPETQYEDVAENKSVVTAGE